MNKRMALWAVLGAVALFIAIGGGWILSLPPAPAASAAEPVARQETEASLAGLRPPKRRRPLIAIVGINDGTETTDYLMPYGILRRADVADVVALATGPGPVTLYPALTVQPQGTIAEFDARHPQGADYVIVPAMRRDDDPAVLRWIREQAASGAIIIGVCAGATIVANAGLLDGRRATTHWYYRDGMLEAHPAIRYVPDRRFVVDRGVATTTGITASMPAMLTLIEAIAGRPRAEAVARDLGLAGWDARHDSDRFRLSRPFALTVVRNLTRFWTHERLGLELSPNLDEVSLALVADAWSRTYRSRATTFSATGAARASRNGLFIVPDEVRADWPADRLLPYRPQRRPAEALEFALGEIAHRYDAGTRDVVAAQLEYGVDNNGRRNRMPKPGRARRAFASCLGTILLMVLFGTGMGAPAAAQPAPATLFVNVNIVPMDRERVLRGQRVLVRDGRIAAIGSRLAASRGSRIIDGRGTAYLLPGLADMHVHVRDRETLATLLASGVTAALDMGEAPNAIVGRTRAAVARGALPGPRLFAALAVDGSPQYGHLIVASPEAARWAVRLAKANGYDFIKVYGGLSPEAFAALVEEGRAVGLPIVGHNVESMGLERQIAAGQAMVAHLEELLYGFFRLPEGAAPQAAPDEAEIARAVDFLRRSGATVTADLATYQTIAAQWGRPEQVQAYLRSPGTRYLSPSDRIDWRRSGYQRRIGSLDARAAFLARFARALAAADVPMIAGTDAPTIPGLVAGEALHRNLRTLEAAGLSRYQVLATATRQPGAFIARVHPQSERFGTVAEGMRADLLLVAGNPLGDLSTLERPLGVMAAGRWHDARALDALRDGVARIYAVAP